MVESMSMLEIKGRHDLKIIFNNLCPEEILKEKSLVGLSGKELKQALKLPFYTSDELEIAVEYGNKLPYFIRIPKGFEWNGANVKIHTVSFLKPFSNTYYTAMCCVCDTTAAAVKSWYDTQIVTKAKESMTIGNNNATSRKISWYACGY